MGDNRNAGKPWRILKGEEKKGNCLVMKDDVLRDKKEQENMVSCLGTRGTLQGWMVVRHNLVCAFFTEIP